MPSLVYAPKVTIRILSTKLGSVVDVTEDIQSWNVHRILGPGVSVADWTLLNAKGKYNGMFSPMDRVIIYLRRLKTVLAFSGYLDEVPVWSALPDDARFSASCTLKILQNYFWDPGSEAAVRLYAIGSGATSGGTDINYAKDDGGLAERTISLLSEVVGWQKDRIHIGSIPKTWFDRLAPLVASAVDEATLATMSLQVGSASYLGGSSPTVGSYTSIPGIGPGTGVLPDTQGKISSFGGPGGGAYGNMALTNESGVAPVDQWYCAMRWPYVTKTGKPVSGVNVGKAKTWWKDQRILVTSNKTHKAVVLRAADWGPHVTTGRVLDVSPTALKKLGIGTDDTVSIAFADQGTKTTPLGPITIPLAAPVQGPGSPTAVSGGWGEPCDESNMRNIKVQGLTFSVHYLAVDKFTGFVNDLANSLGYHPSSIGGYSPRPIAGTSDWSNHAYGAAIDIDPSDNPRYGSAAGGPYKLPHPPAIIELARKWGLGWGGEYQNSKDYMHFEVLGAPASNAAAYPKVTASSATTSTGLSQGTGASTGATSSATNKWVTPIEEPYEITSHFGATGSQWASGMHTGTDFAPPEGEGRPIRPVGPGTVKSTGFHSSYGNYISIDHGEDVYTFYGHMRDPATPSVGDKVDIHSVLGMVGSTGNVSGPHVHLELRLGADTYDAAQSSGGIEKYVPGGAPPPNGVQGTMLSESYNLSASDPTGYGGTGAGAGAIDMNSIGGGLLNVWAWAEQQTSQTSMMLTGKRAVMNDEPVMGTVASYMTAGFRDFCSAPNGDFIGWFPDYFGFYQQAGKMIIAPIEISIENPPSITWSDANLKTHQYSIGTTMPGYDDSGSDWRMVDTAGIATVDNAQLVQALLNVDQQEAEAIAATTSMRYGARPNISRVTQISAGAPEFFHACMEFMKNWSSQWHTTINTTFMPEVFPGMLAVFPHYKLQGYVQEVSHSGDFSGGFRTSISCAPWSTIGDNGPGGMVKGAPL